MKLTTYFSRFAGKKLAVLGLGVSNRPLVRILTENGLDVTACDRATREALPEELLALERQGLKLRLGEDYLSGLTADVVFRTPGILPTRPELQKLRQSGARITSEMEAFFELCPCRIIGVTGSDGKTTTTTLISELLKAAGRRVFLGGNIGTPLLPLADEMREEDFAVVELSSFQLMDMERSPEIAVVTNLAPNHLDMHGSMEEYLTAKKQILLHQSEAGVLVLNAGNARTASLAGEARGAVRFFSGAEPLKDGVWFDGETVLRGEKPLLRREDILLPGLHNVENYMAAISAVEGLVPDECIASVARGFGGVEHRIELVLERGGVRFYNDSIASNPTRTIAGLRSFPEKVILIAGGYDKQIPYDVLGPEICLHVKKLILTGATAGKIRKSVEDAARQGVNAPEILTEDDFYRAIRLAASLAERGDTVLFSPASASFDRFPNFAVRGEEFKKTVRLLS